MYAFASIFKTLGCAVLSPMPTTGADGEAAQIRLANHRYVLAQSNELLLISQRTAALSPAASRIFHVETQVMVSMATNSEEQVIDLCNHSLHTHGVTKTVV